MNSPTHFLPPFSLIYLKILAETSFTALYPSVSFATAVPSHHLSVFFVGTTTGLQHISRIWYTHWLIIAPTEQNQDCHFPYCQKMTLSGKCAATLASTHE